MTTWQGIAGRRILITGATNGIGLAAAKELSHRGAQLAIVARSRERADVAARQIGGQVDVLVADRPPRRRSAASPPKRWSAIRALTCCSTTRVRFTRVDNSRRTGSS
ncbi:MAG TPA: SDR family NAD(P)-dependent oxidoreductase [Candidatus Binatia bacterium]|nr:SDR family NAD(P)-dependent oxidoreductase [Candidatus Binatia bacterium]